MSALPSLFEKILRPRRGEEPFLPHAGITIYTDHMRYVGQNHIVTILLSLMIVVPFFVLGGIIPRWMKISSLLRM